MVKTPLKCKPIIARYTSQLHKPDRWGASKQGWGTNKQGWGATDGNTPIGGGWNSLE